MSSSGNDKEGGIKNENKILALQAGGWLTKVERAEHFFFLL